MVTQIVRKQRVPPSIIPHQKKTGDITKGSNRLPLLQQVSISSAMEECHCSHLH